MNRRRSTVARNTAASTANQVLALLLSFVTTPVVLHALGATAFGTFAVLASLTAYIGVLDLGIGGSLVRYMSFHRERNEFGEVAAIGGLGISYYVAIGLILVPIALISAPAVSSLLRLPPSFAAQTPSLLMFVIGIYVASSISGVLGARLTAAHRLDLSAAGSLTGALVYTALVFLVVRRLGRIEIVFIALAAQVGTTALVLYALNRWVGENRIVSSPFLLGKARFKELFSFGLLSQLTSVTAVVNLEADKAIISGRIGVAQVTPYQLANRLALLNRLLPLQLLGSLLPEITAHVSRGATHEALEQLYASASRNLMLSTLFISGFVAATSATILHFWLGGHVESAATLTVALIISYAVNNATGAGTTIFRAQGRPKYETLYGSISAVLNVALTIALIGPFGLDGVVAGTIIGNVVGSVFFIWLFHRLTGFDWWKTMGSWLSRLIAIACLSGLASHFVVIWVGDDGSRLRDLIALVGAGAAYVISFAFLGRVFGYWDATDYDRLRRLGEAAGLPLRSARKS